MRNFHQNLLHIELPLLPYYYPCFHFYTELIKIGDGLSLMDGHIYEIAPFTFVSLSATYFGIGCPQSSSGISFCIVELLSIESFYS